MALASYFSFYLVFALLESQNLSNFFTAGDRRYHGSIVSATIAISGTKLTLGHEAY